MAEPKHLEILKQGRKAWNHWHINNKENVDLSGAELHGEIFDQFKFDRTNFNGANLQGAIINGCDFQWAYLNKTKLQGSCSEVVPGIRTGC